MSSETRIRHGVATLFAALAVTLLFLSPLAGATTGGDDPSAPDREWRFRVLLDGDEIGYHSFELIDEGERARLRSEASFTVRFLFFDAYKYRHENEEIWRDGCLQAIDARTRVNGKSLEVRGQRLEEAFVVAADQADQALADDCVMSFAYWKPEFLDQERLLNSQTGEYVPVTIEPVAEEELEIRGEAVRAVRYSLAAGNLDMQLWYTPEREWLALESTTEGGRLLRYELR
jgi:hypothetical protein